MCDFFSTDCPPVSLHILGYVALFGNTICMVSAVFHSPIPKFLGLGMRLNDEGVLVVTVQTLLLPPHAVNLCVGAKEVCLQQSWK